MNCVEDSVVYYREQPEVNILLAGTSDGRHILKTLLYISQNIDEWQKGKKVNFYVYEGNKELLCRIILLFHVL